MLAEGIAAAPPDSGFIAAGRGGRRRRRRLRRGRGLPDLRGGRARSWSRRPPRPPTQAGTALVDDVREDLDVTVNPRYGVLDEDGRLVAGEGGVVEHPRRSPDGAGDAARRRRVRGD